MNEGDVVRARTDVGDEVAHPFAALAVGLPAPRAFHAHARIALEQLHFFARIKLFAAPLNQLRLVIEGVALARGAGHEKLNHSSGLGAVMKAAVQFGPDRRRQRPRRCTRQQTAATEQMDQRDGAQPAAEAPKKLAPVDDPRVSRAQTDGPLL